MGKCARTFALTLLVGGGLLGCNAILGIGEPTVGAVLFRALTGRAVHEAQTPELTVVQAATRSADSLLDVLPTASVELANAVDRALATELTSRWPNALAMKEALAAARDAGLSTEARARRSPSVMPDRTHPMTPAATPASDPARPPAGRAPETLVATSKAAGAISHPAGRTSRGAVLALALLGLAVVAGGAVGIAKLGTRTAPPPDVAAAVSDDTAPSGPSTEPEPEPATTPEPAPLASVVTTVDAGARVADERRPAPPPAAKPIAAPRPTPVVAPAASSAAPSAKPGCTPPYTLDANGTKQWKPECFAK